MGFTRRHCKLTSEGLFLGNCCKHKHDKTSGKLYFDINALTPLAWITWWMSRPAHMDGKLPESPPKRTLEQRCSLMLQSLHCNPLRNSWVNEMICTGSKLWLHWITITVLLGSEAVELFRRCHTEKGTWSVHFSKHRPFEAPGSQEVAQGMTKHPYHRSPTSPQ